MRQHVYWIACETTRIFDARKIWTGRIRGGVADRDVTLNVCSDATHPAINCRIGCIDLLLNGRSSNCSAGDIDLGPLRPGRCTSSAARRVNDPERFGTAHFTILHLLHHSIAEAVEGVASTRLRDNVPTRSRIARLTDKRRGAERTTCATVRACSKRPHPKIELC